ncbi:MAG TPA: shikimate dehydrogenase [Pseudohongiella sp.]|nr:shikimate dehydrogenase [Pseudohongiella sp.]
MDRYAVIGYPVAHSKSPFIHEMFAEQTQQALTYSKVEASPEDFCSVVEGFFADGGKGLNVTVPHKERAWEMVAVRTANADKAGAVNTLFLLDDGLLGGDNTDGVGLVRDIEQNHQRPLKDKTVLILGAGGAVRGLLPRLIQAAPARIVIANRTVARAEALQQLFADEAAIEVRANNNLADLRPDWIINGSSAGLQGEMPDLPASLVTDNTSCYDMVYAPGGTVFQHWAQKHGAVLALDGTGMLVEQAAESFFRWRGVRPDTAPVLEALRRLLSVG